MTQDQPISATAAHESTAELSGEYLDFADTESEDLDQESLEAFERILGDQIRISWMQDRRARTTH